MEEKKLHLVLHPEKKKSHLFPALSQFFIMLSYWPFLQQEVLRLSLWGL